MALVVGTNSYISVADADLYFEGRLNTDAWDALDVPTKETSLIQATRQLDQLYLWQGFITDINQTLGWPRIGAYDCNGVLIEDDEIPRGVEEGTCEFALWYSDGNSTSSNAPVTDLSGLSEVKVSSITLKYDGDSQHSSTNQVVSSTIPATVDDAIGCLGELKVGGSGRVTR